MENREQLYGNIKETGYSAATDCGAFCGCACSCGFCVGDFRGSKVESSELLKQLADSE